MNFIELRILRWTLDELLDRVGISEGELMELIDEWPVVMIEGTVTDGY